MVFGPSPIYLIPTFVVGVVVWAYFFHLLRLDHKLALVFMVIFAIPITFLLFFTNYRVIRITDDSITLYSIFGKKRIPLDSIIAVKVVKLGFRKVLWLESKEGITVSPFVFSKISDLQDVLRGKLRDLVDVDGWERSLTDIVFLYLIAILLILVFVLRSI